MEQKKSLKTYYILFTIVFCAVATLCFIWFILAGSSLIWNEDGWMQHFKALTYYSEYLCEIFRKLFFEQKLIIPAWDFYIGEGNDILSTFHYYVIGDPLNFFSVFVPASAMQYFFSFLCILRLYLAGISFSTLCFGTGLKNRYGILSGALAYSFGMWGLLGAVRHPFFLNPMIYFPLIILGIEKIIRKEKPYLLIIATAVSAMSNFYFFYIIVLLAIVYIVFRLGYEYRKQVKQGLKTLLRIVIMASTGVCIAGVLFVPVFMIFLNDSRLSATQPFHLFYPLSYYKDLYSIALTNNVSYWLCIGLSAPVWLAVVLLFRKKKEDIFLKILFIVSLVTIVFPICGRVLNGMSYMSNRWSWAFALLCAYILAKKWDELNELSKKDWIVLISFSGILTVLCFVLDQTKDRSIIIAIIILFITLIIGTKIIRDKRIRQIALVVFVILGILNISIEVYAPFAGDYVSMCVKNRDVWSKWNNDEYAALSALSDSTFTRVTGNSLTKNANIFNRISSTQYFWSLSNPYLNKYRADINILEPKDFNFNGYDDRTTPITLSSTSYYIKKKGGEDSVPYGFSPVDPAEYAQVADRFSIFKNDHSLPLMYCYDAQFFKNEWQKYNPVQRQEFQLDAAFTEKEIPGVEVVDPAPVDYKVPYSMENIDEDLAFTNEGIVTTCNAASFDLMLSKECSESEVYVGFEELEFTPTSDYDLYYGDESVDPKNLYSSDMVSENKKDRLLEEKINSNPIVNAEILVTTSDGKEKKLLYLQPDATFSAGRHDFVINMGYSKEPITSITILFPKQGIYKFKNVNVYSVPMNNYADKVEKLKTSRVDNVKIDTNIISGTLKADKNKLLCLATSYSKGWRAYIDGEKTEVYCLNEHYPGIVVPAGEHEVRFSFEMPYKGAGIVLSLLGIVAYVIIVLYNKKWR